MPRVNRTEICATDEIQVFHLINRCVRRTYLCREGCQHGERLLASQGVDSQLARRTGRDFRSGCDELCGAQAATA